MGIPFLNRIRERYGLKLAVAFTAVLLLTVGVGTVVSADASAQLRDDVDGHMVQTADGRADRLDAWLTGVTTQARVASDHPALRSDDRATVTASLDELASDDRGFYVEDDGPGIPDDGRDVFDAGYTTDDDGTGLGLAIVERIAREHGWSAAVVAADGGGARFEFRS